MVTTLIVIVILAFGALLWLAGTYNGLIGLRNQVLNAFKQIDIQLKRRHDLIPNLVESVKGEMKFEKETLESVIQARAAAVNAGQQGNVKEIAEKEGLLTQALGKLLAISENYPNLKANENVKTLMEELTHTENKISFSRQLYNDLATGFNTRQQVFPNNLIVPMFNFTPAELWELPPNSTERENVKVDLSI